MPKRTQFNYFIGKDKNQVINQLCKYLKKHSVDKSYDMIFSYNEETKEHIIELQQ